MKVLIYNNKKGVREIDQPAFCKAPYYVVVSVVSPDTGNVETLFNTKDCYRFYSVEACFTHSRVSCLQLADEYRACYKNDFYVYVYRDGVFDPVICFTLHL